MRILTYKRTHTGDPSSDGLFGINDCMGGVRSLLYDAVIGVGGTGPIPRRFGISGKVTWVGVGPKRAPRLSSHRAEIVSFDSFVLLEQGGPLLADIAPNLARKVYNGRRFILDKYSDIERSEAVAILQWAQGHTSNTSPTELNLKLCQSFTINQKPASKRQALTMRCIRPQFRTSGERSLALGSCKAHSRKYP